MQNKYDWTFIGAHPSHLFCAAWAAHLGFSVLVLPGKNLIEGFFTPWGGFFNPESYCLLGLLELLNASLEGPCHLFVPPFLKAQFQKNIQKYEFFVFTPDERFMMSSEWMHEFLTLKNSAALMQGIQFGLTHQIIRKNIWTSLTLKKLKHLTPSHIKIVDKGSRHLFLQMALQLGVTIKQESPFHFIFNDQKWITIQSEQGSLIQTKYLMMDQPAYLNQPLLKKHASKKKFLLSEIMQGIVPFGWIFTLTLKMASAVAYAFQFQKIVWQQEHDVPLEIEPQHFLQESSFDFFTVSLRTIFPWSSDSLVIENQKKMVFRILCQLEQMIPFSEQHRLEIYPDFLNEGQPADTYAFKTLDDIPQNLRVYGYDHHLKIQSFQERYFLLSEQSFPEWGFFGSTFSGLYTIAKVCQKQGVDYKPLAQLIQKMPFAPFQSFF